MFDPVDFLNFAKGLNAVDEKTARIGIGRAYYAAHLCAREKVRSHFPRMFPPFRGGKGEHERVRKRIGKNLKRADIAQNLLDLARKRVRADYDLRNYKSSNQFVGELNNAITLSDVILNLLNSL